MAFHIAQTGLKAGKAVTCPAQKKCRLHEPTQTVFKVVFARAGNDEYQLPYLHRYVEKEQELIAQIDDDDLSQHNVRYAKNYFLQSDGIPVIAQEYLPESRFEEYDLWSNNYELNDHLESKGFSDMHRENVRLDRKTKEIVLFDCLQLGGHVIGEVTGSTQ